MTRGVRTNENSKKEVETGASTSVQDDSKKEDTRENSKKEIDLRKNSDASKDGSKKFITQFGDSASTKVLEDMKKKFN